MFLRQFLHSFSEGAQCDWAQVALNCGLFINLSHHGFSSSPLTELPGATSQIYDLHPRLCFRICFGRTQTETIFWIISDFNLKLCPQVFRPAGCPLFLSTMVAVVMFWFLVVPVHIAVCGRLELERSWELACPVEEARQGTEDRPLSASPRSPRGNTMFTKHIGDNRQDSSLLWNSECPHRWVEYSCFKAFDTRQSLKFQSMFSLVNCWKISFWELQPKLL